MNALTEGPYVLDGCWLECHFTVNIWPIFPMFSALVQCIRYIYHFPRHSDMRVSIFVFALPLSGACVDSMCVIPEEGKGKDGQKRWSLQDVHDGRSCQGEQREGGGDPSMLILTNVCIEWGRTVWNVCVCVYWLKRGQSKCPCLPINCKPQGLATVFRHTPLSTCRLALLPDATKGSSESVVIC